MTNCKVYPLHLKSFFIKNYSYLIIDNNTKFAAIVDPSWELETVEFNLRKLDAHLKMILLTHSHFDHVNLVQPLVKRYKPQVLMSSQEIDYYTFKCNNLFPVRNGDSFELGNNTIECILTPGHTAGSMCFLLARHAFFTGDTIFIEGCGACNANGGNPEAMYYSIQMIKNTLPPDVLVYPAHSYGKAPGYPLSHLFKENIYFQIEQLEHFVTFRMRKNQNNLFNFY